MELIKSLAAQMLNQSLNAGRVEFTTDNGEYLSIAVSGEQKDEVTP